MNEREYYMVNIIIALLIFGLVVTVHELGHFIFAKRNGITVNEFSIGMGPRIFSREIRGTRYSLKAFPIGGSCAMGEDEVVGVEDVHAFNNKNVWVRISVIFGGPFFNFVLAYILSVVVIGIVGYDPAVVTSVDSGQPVAEAGLETGDLLKSINGEKISIGREAAMYFEYAQLDGSAITIEYERDGEDYEISYIPDYIKNYLLGFTYMGDSTNSPVAISEISEGYPMASAGVEAGDLILEVNGTTVKDGAELSDYFNQNPLTEEPIELTYSHEGIESTVTITPQFSSEGYSIGFTYNANGRVKTDVLGVLKYSFIEVKYWIVSTVKGIGWLIIGKLSVDNLGGPVRIVSEIGRVVDASKSDGLLYVVLNLINWCILLSANLGVMNLLPLPALDGGRLMFLFLEVLRGKPIDREKEGMVHLVGIILLMILMVVVFFNDIRNIFF